MRPNNTYADEQSGAKTVDDALSVTKPLKSLTIALLKSFTNDLSITPRALLPLARLNSSTNNLPRPRDLRQNGLTIRTTSPNVQSIQRRGNSPRSHHWRLTYAKAEEDVVMGCDDHGRPSAGRNCSVHLSRVCSGEAERVHHPRHRDHS